MSNTLTREMKGKRRPNGVPQRAGFVRISRAASCRRAHPSRRKWARPIHVGFYTFCASFADSAWGRGSRARVARAAKATTTTIALPRPSSRVSARVASRAVRATRRARATGLVRCVAPPRCGGGARDRAGARFSDGVRDCITPVSVMACVSVAMMVYMARLEVKYVY